MKNLNNVWYNESMFRNSGYFLISNNHHFRGIRFLNRSEDWGGGFTLKRTLWE